MATIEDKEFGTVQVRKVSKSRMMRASVAPNGTLRVSVPALTPLFVVKRMISSSRDDIRALFDLRPQIKIEDGSAIGKSHTMIVRSGAITSVKRQGLQIVVTIGPADSTQAAGVISLVHTQVLAALRKEAKHHLPARIKYLASKYDMNYSGLRFTHASSRWGSCNSKKAISLNIALMTLPFELIDYVLLHELAHTIHMDHSKRFWEQVASTDPDYKAHRSQLKRYNPAI